MSILKRSLSIILLAFCVLLLVVIYRAFVLFQPCQHNVEPLSDLNKIKLSSDILNRFQNSLKFETVSFNSRDQNFTELNRYVEFIRKGKKI